MSKEKEDADAQGVKSRQAAGGVLQVLDHGVDAFGGGASSRHKTRIIK